MFYNYFLSTSGGNIWQNRLFSKKLWQNIKNISILKEFINFLAVKTPILSKIPHISSVFKQGVIGIFPKRCFCRQVLWQCGRRTTQFWMPSVFRTNLFVVATSFICNIAKKCGSLNQRGADKWRPARCRPLGCGPQGSEMTATTTDFPPARCDPLICRPLICRPLGHHF